MKIDPEIVVAVFAHNEEAAIATCIESLLVWQLPVTVHVIVNGSSDRTAARIRNFGSDRVHVHEYAESGKARAWNRFVFEELRAFATTHVFVDGDTHVKPGAIAALARELARSPGVNAVAGMPMNGINATANRARVMRDHGVFGALYAVRGTLLARMKAMNVRLPEDLVGDDGLIAALAKTDLGTNADWDNGRVQPVAQAGFVMDRPFSPLRPSTWATQRRRMVRYSIRHFQNKIISRIMAEQGAHAIPKTLMEHYKASLPDFAPRKSLRWRWSDRRALAEMAAAVSEAP